MQLHTHIHTVVSGEESGGEEEGAEAAELSLKMKQDKLEEEKKAIMQNKELLDEVENDPHRTVCAVLTLLVT